MSKNANNNKLGSTQSNRAITSRPGVNQNQTESVRKRISLHGETIEDMGDSDNEKQLINTKKAKLNHTVAKTYSKKKILQLE